MATLTQDDLDAIKGLIKITVQEELEDKLTEKLSFLPTKDEFYEETSKIYKKIQDIEESMDILNNRTAEHTDQIEELQRIHPNNSHSLAV